MQKLPTIRYIFSFVHTREILLYTALCTIVDDTQFTYVSICLLAHFSLQQYGHILQEGAGEQERERESESESEREKEREKERETERERKNGRAIRRRVRDEKSGCDMKEEG